MPAHPAPGPAHTCPPAGTTKVWVRREYRQAIVAALKGEPCRRFVYEADDWWGKNLGMVKFPITVERAELLHVLEQAKVPDVVVQA